MLYEVITAVSGREKTTLLKKIEAAGNRSEWENVGGQLIKASRIKNLLNDIEEERICSWDEIHEFYLGEAGKYPRDLVDHALSSLKEFIHIDTDSINEETLTKVFIRGIEVNALIAERTYESRSKDYQNPFRNMSYSSDKERDAVIGKLDENSFIDKTREDARVRNNFV